MRGCLHPLDGDVPLLFRRILRRWVFSPEATIPHLALFGGTRQIATSQSAAHGGAQSLQICRHVRLKKVNRNALADTQQSGLCPKQKTLDEAKAFGVCSLKRRRFGLGALPECHTCAQSPPCHSASARAEPRSIRPESETRQREPPKAQQPPPATAKRREGEAPPRSRCLSWHRPSRRSDSEREEPREAATQRERERATHFYWRAIPDCHWKGVEEDLPRLSVLPLEVFRSQSSHLEDGMLGRAHRRKADVRVAEESRVQFHDAFLLAQPTDAAETQAVLALSA